MNASKNNALIVFAREPQHGKVKTRLLKDLPADKVTQLYKSFIKDVITMAGKAPCQKRFLYYTGGPRNLPYLSRFKNIMQLKQQRGRDLGERILRALSYCFQQGYHKTIVIGTDCLTINEKDLKTAYRMLSDFDCVIGPSVDGGYYLIGCRKPAKKLFQNIPWSTRNVLSRTLTKARQLKLKVFLMKEKEDIDTFDALMRFYRRKNKKND